ncbi:MAG: PEP-CTERM sorting domain-containing protein [Phycisphaerae bacterium]
MPSKTAAYVLPRMVLPALMAVGLICAQAGAQPTDNPVSSHYGAGVYDWTDQINWSNVHDIADYGGVANDPNVDNTSAFNAARDAAAASGGGVVYFGSGDWHFGQDLYLKSGVVMRGATPGGVNDATQDGYDPASNLIFPKYEPTFTGSGTPNDTAFKDIYSMDPATDSNQGLVNLDINRAGINLGSSDKSSRARNHLVFGVRQNNVTDPDPNVPKVDVGQHEWQRFPYRFSNNVSVNNWRNILIANNRLNDDPSDNFEQPGYLVQDRLDLDGDGDTSDTYELTGEQALFRYTDHYGISAGRGSGGSWSGNRNDGGVDPVEGPSRFRPGIDVVDNYVLTTTRVKLSTGGLGTTISGNVLDDETGKDYWIDPTGYRSPQNAQTFENRGIDFIGTQLLIEDNDYTVYRGAINGGPYYSVDGEGILTQGCCAYTRVDGLVIRNNTGNSYIGIYKMWDIRDVEISGNTLEDRGGVGSGQNILVLADTNNGAASAQYVSVVDNDVAGQIRAAATIEGIDFEILSNIIGTNLEYNDWITASGNTVGGSTSQNPSTIANLPPFLELTNYTMANYKDAYELPDHPDLEIDLQVDASDPDGTVELVRFFNQDVLIGEDTDGSDGWSMPFTADEAGEYMFNAVAYDDDGMMWYATPMYVDMVPEPVTLALLAFGGVGVLIRRRR